MNLGGCKPTPNGDISVSILKLTVDIHLPYIANIINLPIGESPFRNELKLAEVCPVFDFMTDNYQNNLQDYEKIILHNTV